MSVFHCPDCNAKIGLDDYDADYEMYDCPKCGGMWQEYEFVANGKKTAAGNGSGKPQDAQRAVPKAKAKIRQEALDRDSEADAAQIEAIAKNTTKAPKEERHRDEISTALVLNVIADEMEAIAEELGVQISRWRAREFYAMNLYRPLVVSGIRAREQDVPHRLCKEHG